MFIMGNSNKKLFGKSGKAIKNIYVSRTTLRSGGRNLTAPNLKHESEDLANRLACNHQVQQAVFSDFKLESVLGSGAFGVVISVKHDSYPDVLMAMKVQKKEGVVRTKQQAHILSEKHILSCTDFVFIPKLYFCFKDFANLFMVMELIPGGDFFAFTRAKGKMTEDQTKFYVSQVIMAFDYLHGAKVIFRDLKPENLLVCSNGYLKVTDFGFAKIVTVRTYTLCGTPEYLAPEILTHRPYNRSPDWWTVGILTYELLFLVTPFYDPDNTRMYLKIVNDPVAFPKDQKLSNDSKDFIVSILHSDVTYRLGCTKGGPEKIYHHKWFGNFNWGTVYSRQQLAPFLPAAFCPESTTVDPGIIGVSPVDTYVEEFSAF